MDPDDISLSDHALELCEYWNVSVEEAIDARLNGTLLFPDSAVIDDREVYWGPERPDGTHVYLVCSPTPEIINDLRPLRKRPMFEKPFSKAARFPKE